jgi:hypothetical protein
MSWTFQAVGLVAAHLEQPAGTAGALRFGQAFQSEAPTSMVRGRIQDEVGSERELPDEDQHGCRQADGERAVPATPPCPEGESRQRE